MQISGDLGNHGLFAQAIEICVPRFKADVHEIVAACVTRAFASTAIRIPM